MGKLLKGIRFATFRNMLQALPPAQFDVKQESSHEALARHRSLCGPGALAFLRAIPSDPSRVLPPLECVSALRRVIGLDTFLARYLGTGCQARATSTRHIRLWARTDGGTTVHTFVKHRFARGLRDMGLLLTVEDASPMSAGILDIAIAAGSLSDANWPDYRDKGLLVDLTLLDPQSLRQLRRGMPSGSACVGGVAAANAEGAKRVHYAHRERPAFDARSFNLYRLRWKRLDGSVRRDNNCSTKL